MRAPLPLISIAPPITNSLIQSRSAEKDKRRVSKDVRSVGEAGGEAVVDGIVPFVGTVAFWSAVWVKPRPLRAV